MAARQLSAEAKAKKAAYMRDYRKRNKEKLNQDYRDWYEKNKEYAAKAKRIERKRRNRKRLEALEMQLENEIKRRLGQ